MKWSGLAPRTSGSATAFAVPGYLPMWASNLASSHGLMLQAVASAWTMTQLSGSPAWIALVQTALLLPIMLFAMPAGAIADMFNSRTVALTAVGITLCGASALALGSFLGLLSPALLLALCFLVGSGLALLGPAWQACISELVPSEALPSAIALGSINMNLARSFGPAIGGAIVAAAGTFAAYGVNAACYVPSLIALLLWKRMPSVSRLPPERIGRAIVSGMRYVLYSAPTRIILVRTLATAIAGGSVSALMPIVSRELLAGGPQTYGLLLGAFGIGAVVSALNLSRVRGRFANEAVIRSGALASGTMIAVVALSRMVPLTCIALFVLGAVWTATFSLLNINIQMSSPRWVSGRSLAAFQAAFAGGAGIGALLWGMVAAAHGIQTALLSSAATVAACAALGLWLRLPAAADPSASGESGHPADPEVQLGLTARSGPIVIEIEYRIDPDRARGFYGIMQQIRSIRQRNGAHSWSLSRDIADPALWVERYHCPTWLDYLHQRTRSTKGDREIEKATLAMHMGPEPIRVRRLLDRPPGSVRWKDSAPDRGIDTLLPLSALPGASV